MSDFELQKLSDGVYALRGEMSFETADRILRMSESLFEDNASIEIDLQAVSKADSAGLALMLEWQSRALSKDSAIRFIGVPESLLAIAKTTEVSDLISASTVR